MTRTVTTAEDALRERNFLAHQYRERREAYREALYKRPGGAELREFAVRLRRYGASDATAMLDYVRQSARTWLATAEPQIRTEALSLCNERIIAIRTRSGRVPFDDPLPGDADEHNVWQQCKAELT